MNLDLFNDYVPPPLPSPPKAKAFDGKTYEPDQDHARLKGQLLRVFELMQDGKWRTLGEIADAAGGSEASCSARLRDLRKLKYGSHDVQREHLARGLWRYRLMPATKTVG